MDFPRVMVFVDGTNLLVRLADEIKQQHGCQIEFRADKPPKIVIEFVNAILRKAVDPARHNIIRRYWFGSYTGSEEYQKELNTLLRENNFEPVLFKKEKGREKGVDIALTKEMLVNAFNQNLDISYLIAGDEDYCVLVNEVKRYGPRVHGSFFKNGLSPKLRIAFDNFSFLPNIRANSNLNEICLQLITELNK